EAVRLASKEKPDILLLDLMLPGIDGFQVCEILKRDTKTSRILIIMLTGKGSVTDITRGLAQYADDYITKPFEPAILIARIHAVLRRKLKNDNVASDILIFDRLTLDLNAHEVRIDGEIVDLTKTEFDMLLFLARKPNIVFSRAQVLDYIREDNYDVTERIVDYQVFGLRKKLSKVGHFIETVRGVGYKFRV
ncbi:MAG: hypothetical protein QG657_5139, partial [Acidobacteriota bacterium]|nr:hypothetical protein [Acidobacteriota bacterium]